VTYDREDPSTVTVAIAERLGWLFPVVGTACLGSGVVLGLLTVFVVAPMAEASSGMDRAVDAFLAEVRAGVPPPRRVTTAPGAQIDEAYLAAHGGTSPGFDRARSASNLDDGCVQGAILPSRTTLTLYLVNGERGWRVVRAGRDDPECEVRLRD
jgi:hypothetical protein